MKRTIIYLPILMMLFFGSCTKNTYISKDIDTETQGHETVAILPVQVETTGRLPKNLSASEIRDIELAESELFQDIVLTAIQRNNRRGKNPYSVNFMSNRETLAKLEANGISIEDAYTTQPSVLAEVLGVDAVVRADVKKTRYMSDEASLLIRTGTRILNRVDEIFIPGSVANTYSVDMQLELVNAADGNTLYSRYLDLDINHRRSVDDAVQKLSKRMGRFFPYKKS